MIILKLGGSVITKKAAYMKEDGQAIAKLASAVARAWRAGVHDLIIVNGAGSFGHAPVIKYGINDGVRSTRQRLGFASTHASVVKLNSLVVDALIARGVPAISVPPAIIAKQSGKKNAKINKLVLAGYLSSGYVPVLFGDLVLDSKLGGSVLSGDRIISLIGKRAKRVVLATDVDGIYADGKVAPSISRANFAKMRKHLSRSDKPDVTGGMAGKVSEIMKCGAPSFVVNGKRPERVLALLLGKKAVGTKISF